MTGHDHPGDADPLGVAILTVSTSRANAENADDPGGDALAAAVAETDHDVVERALVADDFAAVRRRVAAFADTAGVDVVVTTGGTGVSPDDVTVEAVRELLDTDLPGFGEAFRRESYDEIGARAIGSRATAGLVGSTPVFCLPGSVGAVELGAELVLDAAPHLVAVARE